MVEKRTSNVARNIANGIILQVCDLGKMKEEKKKQDLGKRCQNATEETGKKNKIMDYITMFASEFIGTGLLLFLGCMGCVSGVDNPAPPHHMYALSFGLVILIIIQAFGHISGAHLNPAVSIAALINKMINPTMTLVYVAGQFAGAIAGFALLKISLPSEFIQPGLCLTLPLKTMSSVQAFLVELSITTVLIIVVCAVWDKRNADKPDSVPLRFALIVTGISMVAGPFTGASMNTARTFAPALLEGNYNYQWIYWVAPNVGALLGCAIYKFLFALPDECKSNEEEAVALEEINDSKGKNFS